MSARRRPGPVNLNETAGVKDDEGMASNNSFDTRTPLTVGGDTVHVVGLPGARRRPGYRTSPACYSLKILLCENLLRREDARLVDPEDIRALAGCGRTSKAQRGIASPPLASCSRTSPGSRPSSISRPCVTGSWGSAGVPRRVNPLQPVELVIDHSVQVDHYSERNAADLNAALESPATRSATRSCAGARRRSATSRVVPPDTGIVHQVKPRVPGAGHLPRRGVNGRTLAYPDTLVGTDSHTTMVNGLGVVGWGVGGIEAEAAMLGQPISMLIPEVVGFRLTDRLPEGATATDSC